MGCDIHCYAEYRRPAARRHDGELSGWNDFGGRINPGRRYDIFECMAGVRGDDENAVVPPRGLPDHLAYAARSDAWLWIDYNARGECVCGESRYVTQAQAESWGGFHSDRDQQGRPTRVAAPDYHSHSWLTPTEFEHALLSAEARPDDSPEYFALLAALRALESAGNETRLVFWFDN